jgi:hypothetical protein
LLRPAFYSEAPVIGVVVGEYEYYYLPKMGLAGQRIPENIKQEVNWILKPKGCHWVMDMKSS